MQVKPLSAAVGAEIIGFDIHAPADHAPVEQLRAAFRDHHLLLLRDPDISEAEQSRFAQIFGEITIRNRYAGGKGPANNAQYVSNNRADGILGDGEIVYHQDHTFYDQPLTAIMLYGIEVPQSGSATKFRNTGAILQRLPRELRARADGVKCLHLYDYNGDYTKWQDPKKASPDSPRAWHPLVWTNPKTGQQALWAIPISTVDFEGIPFDEGKDLLDQVWEFANGIDADYTYVHHWAPGDLVIWNNLMLQHARLPFNSNEPRTLRRTPIV
jgi:alpha-ketoglutarate-dependent taurine dioxygenase